MSSDELNELLNVPYVLWFCPRGHRNGVLWNDARTEATCQTCGLKSTDPEAIKEWESIRRFREMRDEVL